MTGEVAHYWRHPALPDVGLLRARYVTHRFSRHVHDGYAIGVVLAGVEEFEHPVGVTRAGPGAVVAVNPGTVHTGHAGVPEGWAYRMTYPAVDVMTDIAAELGLPRGTPAFAGPVLDDPDSARRLRAVHRAGEAGDALAASTMLRTAYAGLLRRHAARFAAAGPPDGPPALPPVVRDARDVLHASLVDPPTLEELAATVGTRPFPLLRAFREATGLPPHAYLNQARVRAACALLDEGLPPGDVASRTGFADQAHLTRHFKRTMGVPPGAYRAARGLGGEPWGSGSVEVRELGQEG